MENKIPWNLLAKLFNETISKSESEELEIWLQSSDLNHKIYEELIEDPELRKNVISGRWEHHSREWQKVYSKLKVPFKRVTVSSTLLYLVSGIAAVVIIFFGYYSFKQYTQSKQRLSDPSYTYIFSPRGQRTKVVLPDKTRVWLNAESSLKYYVSFDQMLREVTLNGEAFFEVSKNPQKPFIVNAEEIKVKVYGTSFNIKAFPQEKYIETTLIEGKLSVMPLKAETKNFKEIYLKPKEKCIYEKSTGSLTKDIDEDKVAEATKISKPEIVNIKDEPKFSIERNINPEQEELWKDGKLIFRNETFDELAIRLERWFDVKIHFEDEVIKSYKFTGVFEKETINQAMEALRLSSKKSYKYNIVFRDIYLKLK